MPDLTPDPLLLGSPSYRGLSSRIKMWLGLALLLGAGLLLHPYEVAGEVALLLFTVSCIWPLYIRRARQMGVVWYGVLAIALPYALALAGTVLVYAQEQPDRVGMFARLSHVPMVLHFVMTLPLCLFGGDLSGRKSELMRAAIDGDMHGLRDLLAARPGSLLQRSEKGLCAREYAELMGHRDIADFLRIREDEEWL